MTQAIKPGSGQSAGGGRRRRVRLLAAALAATALEAGCAASPDWVPFFEGPSVTWSYDPASLRQPAKGRARVLVLENHPRRVIDRRTGQDYLSARHTWEFTCENRTMSRFSVIQYGGAMGSGANLSDPSASGKIAYADPQTLSSLRDEEDRPVRIERVLPGGAEDAMLQRLCGSR